jgi:hypothetical protein
MTAELPQAGLSFKLRGSKLSPYMKEMILPQLTRNGEEANGQLVI